jgi:hypothetical protein
MARFIVTCIFGLSSGLCFLRDLTGLCCFSGMLYSLIFHGVCSPLGCLPSSKVSIVCFPITVPPTATSVSLVLDFQNPTSPTLLAGRSPFGYRRFLGENTYQHPSTLSPHDAARQKKIKRMRLRLYFGFENNVRLLMHAVINLRGSRLGRSRGALGRR